MWAVMATMGIWPPSVCSFSRMSRVAMSWAEPAKTTDDMAWAVKASRPAPSASTP